MTLGELIEALKAFRPSADVVVHGPVYLGPTSLDSYRGFYDQLALGVSTTTRSDVSSLLFECDSAVGQTFGGYKGGTYLMGLDTPVWLSNYGECSGTQITGLVEGDGVVEIRWEKAEW